MPERITFKDVIVCVKGPKFLGNLIDTWRCCVCVCMCYVCMCVHACVHMCICMCVCVCVCMYACKCPRSRLNRDGKAR